jgi:DNA-binding LytR/AlgR family response regulator
MLEAAGVEVVGEAGDGLEAMQRIEALRPDVVFLDIRMPVLDGLSLAAADRVSMPPIVFTTAYDEYAVRAFDAEAVDYVLKPVEPERLQRALDKVEKLVRGAAADKLEAVLERLREDRLPPRVAARAGSSAFVFDAREILRFSATKKYVAFGHRGREYLTEESLSALEQRLAAWGFVRVHRGELVNLARVVALHLEGTSATLELVDGTRVGVSRRRLPELRRALRLSGDDG